MIDDVWKRINSFIEKSNKYRKTIFSFIIVFILSAIIFAPFDSLTTAIYLWIIVLLLIIPLYFHGSLYTYLVPGIANAAAFAICRYHKVHSFSISVEKVLLIFVIAIEIAALIKRNKQPKTQEKKTDDNKSVLDFHPGELLPKRKYDYERLEEYLEFDTVVGVCGDWGTGKSFLVDQFIAEHKVKDEQPNKSKDTARDNSVDQTGDDKEIKSKEAAEFIRLGLLELNDHDPIKVFLWTIDNLLRKYGYFSRNSKAVSQLTGNHAYLNDFTEAVFPDYETVDDSIKQLKDRLQSLDCTVYFVIEDLDRLQDKEKIRTVLALCERLAEKNVKFIVEFDLEILKDIDPTFSYKYVEKFIPNTVSLTPIRIEEMFKFFIKPDTSNKPKRIGQGFSLEDVAYRLIHKINYSYVELDKALDQYGLKITHADRHTYPQSVRATINLLKELEKMLDNEKKHDSYANKRRIDALAGILYIKYMEHSSYEKCQWWESPLDSLSIKIEEPDHTNRFIKLPDLIRLSNDYLHPKTKEEKDRKTIEEQFKKCVKDLRDTFIPENNYEYYEDFLCLYIMGYQMPVAGASNNYDMKVEHANREIDQIVKNQLANGLPEYTKEQNFVREMNKVLAAKDPEQEFEKLNNDLFYENTYKNSETIYLMGTNGFQTIFKSYYLCENKTIYWIKLIDFYDLYTTKNNNKILDIAKLIILTYCAKFRERKVFFRAIELFFSFSFENNFNNHEEFMEFINEYIDSIFYHGFFANDIHAAYGILHDIMKANQKIDYINGVLDDYIQVLEKYENKDNDVGLKYCAKDYNILINFIGKLKDIMKNSTDFKKSSPFHVEISSELHHANSKVYEDLKKSRDVQQVDEAYKDGQINVAEAHELVYKEFPKSDESKSNPEG